MSQGVIKLPISIRGHALDLRTDYIIDCDGCFYTYDVYETPMVFGQECTRLNMAYIGTSVSSITTLDPYMCRAKCVGEILCQGWNHDNTNGNCELLSSISGSESRPHTSSSL